MFLVSNELTERDAKMTISKRYALSLIKSGKATMGPVLVPDERGHIYQAIDRHDVQRVDHYRVS